MNVSSINVTMNIYEYLLVTFGLISEVVDDSLLIYQKYLNFLCCLVLSPDSYLELNTTTEKAYHKFKIVNFNYQQRYPSRSYSSRKYWPIMCLILSKIISKAPHAPLEWKYKTKTFILFLWFVEFTFLSTFLVDSEPIWICCKFYGKSLLTTWLFPQTINWKLIQTNKNNTYPFGYPFTPSEWGCSESTMKKDMMIMMIMLLDILFQFWLVSNRIDDVMMIIITRIVGFIAIKRDYSIIHIYMFWYLSFLTSFFYDIFNFIFLGFMKDYKDFIHFIVLRFILYFF